MPTPRISAELISRHFGLISLTESARVVLPLKGVECGFSVRAGLVEVLVTQIFRQENNQPLDCEYLFPLPADASVYSCEADINGRLIAAKVREREEAVKLAAEKKAEGRRVALVEAERENLFTLTLNNLQPDDLILVRLKYIQPLRSLADLLSVEIPFCPGIRYIPGNPLIRANRGKGVVDDTDEVPDASRISPVRIDADHPDAAYVEIRGTIDGGFVDATSVMSPSHNVISRVDAGNLTIRLSDKGEVPDRDFVVRWRETQPERLAARAWIQDTGNETYALMEIRAPEASGPPAPMDFYFLVDQSGSMQGVKYTKAMDALRSSVRGLDGSDRVMVTLFDNQYHDFAEKPLAPAQLLEDRNFEGLRALCAAGGTELGPALKHVIEIAGAHSAGREKALILITDAQVGNDAAIQQIMESAVDFPVHCFGIDFALNDSLLLALVRQQGGTFQSLNPAEDVAKAVSDLAQTIRHPVLRNLRLSDGWDTAHERIPALHSGQIHYLSARSSTKDTLGLTAQNGGATAEQIPIVSQPATGAAPRLHWCKNRIQRCLTERRNSEAIALSVESNLICPLTAFIAWDEFEKVAVANRSLVQPAFAAGRAAVSAHLVGPSYRLRESFAGITADSEFRQGITMHLTLQTPPPYPGDIVEMIAGFVPDSYGRAASELLTMEARCDVFGKFVSDICRHLSHPEWMPLYDNILAWLRANSKDSITRSRRVAVLLSELNGHFKQILGLRQEILLRIRGNKIVSASKSESVARLETMLAGKLHDQTSLSAQLDMVAKAQPDWELRDVASRMDRITAIEKEMRGKLDAFIAYMTNP